MLAANEDSGSPTIEVSRSRSSMQTICRYHCAGTGAQAAVCVSLDYRGRLYALLLCDVTFSVSSGSAFTFIFAHYLNIMSIIEIAKIEIF
jgi:hypothetical protein